MLRLFKVWYAKYTLFKYRRRKMDTTRIKSTIDMLTYLTTLQTGVDLRTLDDINSSFKNYYSLAAALRAQLYLITNSHSKQYSINRVQPYLMVEWFVDNSSYSVSNEEVLNELLTITTRIEKRSTDQLKEVLLAGHAATWDSIDMYIEFIIKCYTRKP